MKDYVILTDSSCDLSEEYMTENQVPYVPLQFVTGETTYNNYMDGRELSTEEFYSRLQGGEVFKTNQVNVEKYLEIYEELAKTGKDILVLAFSSGLSGTCNSAMIAKNMFEENHQDTKIIVVDTLAASAGEGLLLHYVLEQKKAGKTIEEAAKWAEDHKLNLAHWFTVANLDTLKRGGRVSASAAFIANAFRIKPVLHVDNEGHLINVAKVLGRKPSIKALRDEMKKTYMPQYKTIFISHANCKDDAEYLKSLILETYPNVTVELFCIGPVIGSHSGPGTIALFFMGKNR